MHRPHRFLASLFMTAALAAPVSIMALPVPQEAGVQVRVHDKGHKDYHNWDDNENRAWGQYSQKTTARIAKLEDEQKGTDAILELAPSTSRSARTS